jgi:DNA polymerase III sliding clamp (beta) subunit (PCNA family)
MNSEIKLTVADLKQALPGLRKVIGNARSLPVIQSVRISRNSEGAVTLHATDLDSFLTYRVEGVQQGPPTEVLVPVEHLAKAVKCSASKKDIGIISESKDKVKLRYNIAGNVVEQNISTLSAADFPPAPVVKQPGTQLEPQFVQALKEALSCCSADSSRRVLNGACLDVTDKKLHYIVGTNGRCLYSANSFCFDLKKSVVIPDSKFLEWPDLMEEEPVTMSLEPGEEEEPAKNGKPAKEAKPGWIKFQTSRWTYITKEIDGKFPNWKQAVPETNGKWTRINLSDEAIKQLLLIIPSLPGDDSINRPVRLRVESQQLSVEGQNRDDDNWTSIPIQNVKVTGKPVPSLEAKKRGKVVVLEHEAEVPRVT